MMRHTVLVVLFLYGISPVLADDLPPADVEFHTAALAFACNDKTPKEFAAANPTLKIIEASIRISATLNIAEDRLDRLEYKLRMPEAFEITDYLPKTTLKTDVDGKMKVDRQESAKSLRVVSSEGGAKASFSRVEINGKVDENKTEEKGIGSNIQLNQLPPMQLINATSTQDVGRTLNFKLKPFSQLTLEGDKDFAFLAAVPKDWTGDCLTLECRAFLKDSPQGKTPVILFVGLYMNGDAKARARAMEAVTAAEKEFAKSKEARRMQDDRERENARAKYAGNYYISPGSYYMSLNSDGNVDARFYTLVGIRYYKGKWDIEKDNVIHIEFCETTLGNTASPTNYEVVKSHIIDFDANNHVIKTEKGYTLRFWDKND